MAGTALGVPVVGTVIGALSGAAIGAARKRTNTKGEGGCTKKEELNDEEAIDQAESEVGHRPQGYQEDRGQKDGKGQWPESRARKAARASKRSRTAKKPGRKSSKSR